jgi:hypothetical protein
MRERRVTRLSGEPLTFSASEGVVNSGKSVISNFCEIYIALHCEEISSLILRLKQHIEFECPQQSDTENIKTKAVCFNMIFYLWFAALTL